MQTAKLSSQIAHEQQLAPGTGHTHAHAAAVGQETNIALGVAAGQGDGHAAARLALPRIAGLFAWLTCPTTCDAGHHALGLPMRTATSPCVRPWSRPTKN